MALSPFGPIVAAVRSNVAAPGSAAGSAPSVVHADVAAALACGCADDAVSLVLEEPQAARPKLAASAKLSSSGVELRVFIWPPRALQD